MTWVKQHKNYIKFFYATEPDDKGKWGVWVREFIDVACTKPVTQMRRIESYDTAEAAETAANEFQSVSN